MNHFYVDMGVKVIQLKRRKEPRFHIPKGWNQSGAIFLPKANEILKCSLIDISKSGVRFEVLDQIKTTFKRDDILKIKFQIHKRAEVQTTAIVRFALHRPNANSIIGMEFATISEVQNERVSSIVEDIQMFNSTQKS
jgi:c-di-GMP-binding flagellar brake protein YcgR